MRNVKVEDDDEKINQIIKEAKKLTGAELKIGVFAEDDSFEVMKASVHEFGVSIEVTEKMRGWFWYQGYHIAEDTEEIKIPERSFLRSSFDENKGKITRYAGNMLAAVLEGNMKADEYMDRLGVWLEALVKDKIHSIEEPPLSDMTKERRRKGGNASPLQDTGSLWQHITFKVDW